MLCMEADTCYSSKVCYCDEFAQLRVIGNSRAALFLSTGNTFDLASYCICELLMSAGNDAWRLTA